MGSKAFPIFRATSSTTLLLNKPIFKSSLFLKALIPQKSTAPRSYSVRSALEPPDLHHLAQTARISLTPHEIEEFAPKIQQVVDWFGQLQGVDLQSVQPSIRADTEGQNLRDDLPETFKNREPMIAAVPNYEDPFIKVPKVLNKERLNLGDKVNGVASFGNLKKDSERKSRMGRENETNLYRVLLKI